MKVGAIKAVKQDSIADGDGNEDGDKDEDGVPSVRDGSD